MSKETQKLFSLSLFKDAAGYLSTDKVAPIKDLCKADAFVETGTYLGDTTAAMRSLFSRVISIELSEELHAAAKRRFSSDSNVTLIKGNSAERIGDALALVGEARPLMWLDAHWSGGATAKADENTPILSEIRQIREAGRADVVILVDDISFFWSVNPGFNVHESIGGYPEIGRLIDELKATNPAFCIFVNCDVMIAIPKALMGSATISAVLEATSRLRTGQYSAEELSKLETTVAEADGEERETIIRLPEHYAHALSYGIGGHFCYWRGLVRERDGEYLGAAHDFNLARSCGIRVVKRQWEPAE